MEGKVRSKKGKRTKMSERRSQTRKSQVKRGGGGGNESKFLQKVFFPF